MGNIQSSIQPLQEHNAPWIMVTYNPGSRYKNFSYNETFDVYTNKIEKLNSLSVEPEQPTDDVEYKVSNKTVAEAIQEVNFEDDMTVKELVDGLLQKCCHGNKDFKDADKVKILFYWLTAQNVKYSEYNLTVDFETVNYQLQRLHDGKNSYAAFFSLLCSYAEVPCVIIRGHVKGGRYEVDRPLTDDLLREWNAVFVDDMWRLVDTFWGRIYQAESITREEWYLFPNPNYLKYSHFPENKAWQLLKEPITEDEFIRLPVLKKRFFEMDMELLSHKKGNVRCPSGELELTFQLNSKNLDSQEFRCVISRQNDEKKWEEETLPGEHLQLDFIEKTSSAEEDMHGGLDETDDIDTGATSGSIPLRKMSTVATEDSSIFTALTVKVRFPKTGYHKLEIVGHQREDEEYDWVAIYHVNVTYVPDWLVFFPRMADIGWGPNPYLKKCGLRAVSHANGEIKCFAPKDLDIIFQILPTVKTKGIKVKLRYKLKNVTSLDDITKDEEESSEGEIFTPAENNIIKIPVYIEFIGEYKLSIAAMLNETDKGDVIHYRIQGEEDQSKIQEELALEVLKELEEAIKSEEISNLKKAINSATSKEVQSHPKVRSRYREAYKLLKALQNYKDALKRIGQINYQHIANLKSYSSPDPGIVKVMRAVFILLGEQENRLRNWDEIKVFLKGRGPDSVNRRINKVDVKALPAEVVAKAKKELGDLNTIGTLKKAEDVAAFAKWMEFVFKTSSFTNKIVAREPGPSEESQV